MTANKRERDYTHEYELRKKKIKRLNADIERAKVDAFKALLEKRGTTFVKWLENKIDEEMN